MVSFFAPIMDFILNEKSELTSSVGSSATSVTLPVLNTQGLKVNDFLVIGRIGHEESEIQKITEITDATQLKIEKLNIDKKKGDPIQKISFNQVRLYRSTSKTGTYTLLKTKDIEVDNPRGTYFEDLDGTTSHWYKCTYYNSQSTIETSLDDAEAVQGGDVQHYASIHQIKRMAGFEENYAISPVLVSDIREAAENEINSRVVSVYSVPFSTVPPLITHITSLLAAGMLLLKEYGVEADIEISKSGQRMINEARSYLDRIVAGTLKLIDASGNELARSAIFKASGSNVYDGITADKGEMFNLADEHFMMKDPDKPKS